MSHSDRPIVFFAHANGFPAGSYRRFIEPLAERFDVRAPEMLGHNPDYPPTPNWKALADELLDELSTQTAEPVIGIGHSMGGVLTFMAAVQQPRRFRAFIMLDPPVVFGPAAWMTALAKGFGFIDSITPAGRSAGRRRTWSGRDEAIAYFRDKGLFRRFDPRCLADYVDAGTVPTAEGLSLVYEPEKEVEIFRTIPHDLALYPAPVRVPGAIVVGSDSNVTRADDIQRMAKRHGLRVREAEGGHMFPFENPETTASLVTNLIDDLLAAAEVEEQQSAE